MVSGEYKEATNAWKEASSSDNPALVAQSHYRRLLTASNLGWAVHGVLGDAALAQCPLNDTRCALANVDRELYMSLMGLPADLKYARELSERLLQHRPEEATARLVWLGTVPISSLEAFNHDDLDGIGQCFLKSRHNPMGQRSGGAYIRFGLYGGGRWGIGWFHVQPNIDKRGGQLRTSVALTTQYAGGLFISYTSVGEKWIQVNSNLTTATIFLVRIRHTHIPPHRNGGLSLRPGLQWDTGQAWLGPFFRQEGYTVNDAYQLWRGVGLSTGAMWKPMDTMQFYVTSEYIEWEYHHLRVNGQMMWIHPSGWASMIEISASPNTEGSWCDCQRSVAEMFFEPLQHIDGGMNFLPSGVLEYRWRSQDTISWLHSVS